MVLVSFAIFSKRLKIFVDEINEKKSDKVSPNNLDIAKKAN